MLIGPSGSGKTTLIKRLLQRSDSSFLFVPSTTTRPRRPGERDGVDYRFVTEEEFQDRIRRGDFFEWQKVHAHWYGSSRERVQETIEAGRIGLTSIDILGSFKVKNAIPEDVTTIFIAPPSIEELRRRIYNRGSEGRDEVDRRLRRVKMELELAYASDYILVNRTMERAEQLLLSIIETALAQKEARSLFDRVPTYHRVAVRIRTGDRVLEEVRLAGLPETMIGPAESETEAAIRLFKAVWWQLFPSATVFELPAYRMWRESRELTAEPTVWSIVLEPGPRTDAFIAAIENSTLYRLVVPESSPKPS